MNDRSYPSAEQMVFDTAAARALLAQRLEAVWSVPDAETRALTAAARYTLLQPGKRIRGVFTMMVADAWGAPPERAVDAAAAIELVHAASLIIDDLPSMDDGTVRRGVPTNHLAHGEATAILAAFALMSEAFGVVANCPAFSPEQRAAACTSLSAAIGPLGLTGGQHGDLNAVEPTLARVERVHWAKTAALFIAAAELGSIAAGIAGPRRTLMMDCGACIGLAFQALDDVLDVSASTAVAGKDVGQDAGRPNIVNSTGHEVAATRIAHHIRTAHDCLKASGARPEAITALIDGLAQSAFHGAPVAPATRPPAHPASGD